MKTTTHNPAHNTASGHTPGPWFVAQSKSGVPFITNSTGKFTVANSFSNVEDAAFAVLACNNHTALVEALEGCVKWMEFTIEQLQTHNQGDRLNWGGPISKARAALTRAKGGEVS